MSKIFCIISSQNAFNAAIENEKNYIENKINWDLVDLDICLNVYDGDVPSRYNEWYDFAVGNYIEKHGEPVLEN